MRQKYLSTFRSTPLRCLFAATLLSLLPGSPLPAHASDIVATRTALAATPFNNTGATLTATVTTAEGSPATSGTVDFVLPDGQSLGSARVDPSGIATLSLSRLPAATGSTIAGKTALSVTAQYNATTPAYAASVSGATAVASPEASNATTGFTITANPSTVTVNQGDYSTTAITVTSVGNFTGPVSFSCTGLPAQATCSFNPNQETVSENGSFVSTLQISTQGASGTASSALDRHAVLAMAWVLPGGLLLLVLSRRKRWQPGQWLAVALLVGGAGTGLAGCSQRYGYLHHPPSVATGTPAGTYSVNIVADGDELSTAYEQTLNLSLVVQ